LSLRTVCVGPGSLRMLVVRPYLNQDWLCGPCLAARGWIRKQCLWWN